MANEENIFSETDTFLGSLSKLYNISKNPENVTEEMIFKVLKKAGSYQKSMGNDFLKDMTLEQYLKIKNLLSFVEEDAGMLFIKMREEAKNSVRALNEKIQDIEEDKKFKPEDVQNIVASADKLCVIKGYLENIEWGEFDETWPKEHKDAYQAMIDVYNDSRRMLSQPVVSLDKNQLKNTSSKVEINLLKAGAVALDREDQKQLASLFSGDKAEKASTIGEFREIIEKLVNKIVNFLGLKKEHGAEPQTPRM